MIPGVGVVDRTIGVATEPRDLYVGRHRPADHAPEVAFSSFAPDITSMVLVGGGWLLVGGGLLGVIGVVRRVQRSRQPGPVPTTG